MSKIIIHNKTNLTEEEILQYVSKTFHELSKLSDLLEGGEKVNSYFEFTDGVKVRYCQRKTCKTFYIYN